MHRLEKGVTKTESVIKSEGLCVGGLLRVGEGEDAACCIEGKT